MADEFKVFEIDDNFDPLADLHVDEGDEIDDSVDTDYQVPTIAPEDEVEFTSVDATASVADRLAQLVEGMPGQKARLMHAIELCRERTQLEDFAEALDGAFPNDRSVYDPARVAQLLERAGALVVETEKDEQDADASERPTAPGAPNLQHQDEETVSADALGAQESAEGDYLVVVPVARTYYTASEEGLAVAEQLLSADPVLEAINEQDGKYRAVYETVLRAAAAEGGTSPAALDAVFEGDPLLASPKRYATFFLRRLEEVDALRFVDSWVATELGQAVLESEFTKGE